MTTENITITITIDKQKHEVLVARLFEAAKMMGIIAEAQKSPEVSNLAKTMSGAIVEAYELLNPVATTEVSHESAN